jgi:hypothetical protein
LAIGVITSLSEDAEQIQEQVDKIQIKQVTCPCHHYPHQRGQYYGADLRILYKNPRTLMNTGIDCAIFMPC